MWYDDITQHALGSMDLSLRAVPGVYYVLVLNRKRRTSHNTNLLPVASRIYAIYVYLEVIISGQNLEGIDITTF